MIIKKQTLPFTHVLYKFTALSIVEIRFHFAWYIWLHYSALCYIMYVYGTISVTTSVCSYILSELLCSLFWTFHVPAHFQFLWFLPDFAVFYHNMFPVLRCIVLYCTVLYNAVLNCIVLCRIALHCVVLNCRIAHCIVLRCICPYWILIYHIYLSSSHLVFPAVCTAVDSCLSLSFWSLHSVIYRAHHCTDIILWIFITCTDRTSS